MQSTQRKKVGWAVVAGISFGVVAATLSVHRPAFRPRETTTAPYIVPVAATGSNSASREQSDAAADSQQLDAQQMERLKTRNRRLEALVTVLRHRATERQ